MPALLVMASIPLGIAVNGLVVSVLWGWFAVPLGLGAIGIAHACGLAMMAYVITGNTTPDPTEEERTLSGALTKMGGHILGRLLTLAIGALYVWLM